MIFVFFNFIPFLDIVYIVGRSSLPALVCLGGLNDCWTFLVVICLRRSVSFKIIDNK